MPRAPRRCSSCETDLVYPPAKYCVTCTPLKAWQGAGKGRGGRAWSRTREDELERDDYRCYDCGQDGCTQVDHIVPVALGGTDDPENLAAMCDRCHVTKTRRERDQVRLRG